MKVAKGNITFIFQFQEILDGDEKQYLRVSSLLFDAFLEWIQEKVRSLPQTCRTFTGNELSDIFCHNYVLDLSIHRLVFCCLFSDFCLQCQFSI